MIQTAIGGLGVILGMTVKPLITSVDPWTRQPSFTAVPEAACFSVSASASLIPDASSFS
jgi:hypothetical protein